MLVRSAVHDDVMKNSLMDALTSYSSNSMQATAANNTIGKVMNILNQFLPIIAKNSNRELILDDGTLVGRIAPQVDLALGSIATGRMRGH